MSLLRDRKDEFEAAGVSVYGISRDSPYSHRAWTEALNLNFSLLSDWTGEAVRGFGVAREYKGFSDVPIRSAFLVDSNGIVCVARRYEDSEVPDFDELLEAARCI